MSDWLSPDTERAAAILEAHPDYRVLRSLPPLHLLPLPVPEGKVRTAAVLDTETTSLDPATGHIIELAICTVTFDGRGRIVGIGPVHDWFEDPGYPLPPEIVRLTGLDDAGLAGRRIDDAAVIRLLSEADLVIAHNASFDSEWIERRYPEIAGKPWVCSLKDIDWQAMRIDARKLGGLLATMLSTGRTACSEMILTAQHPTIRITADGAPFEFKDRLKARGYRWDQKLRRWWIEVTGNAADEERVWLAAEAGCRNPTLIPITWHQRHRA